MPGHPDAGAAGAALPTRVARPDTTDSTATPDTETPDRGTGDTSATPRSRQRPWHEEAWNRIAEIDGVVFSYLYYSGADEVNDGIVIRLENTRDRAVQVSFTILFRRPTQEATAEYMGRLAPGEMKTGGNDGLYWVPFASGKPIGEVGLRGVHVK